VIVYVLPFNTDIAPKLPDPEYIYVFCTTVILQGTVLVGFLIVYDVFEFTGI